MFAHCVWIASIVSGGKTPLRIDEQPSKGGGGLCDKPGIGAMARFCLHM